MYSSQTPWVVPFDTQTLCSPPLMGFIHVVMLQAALHPEMDSGRVLVSGFFLFFALMGSRLGQVRRNFWMGVRTPWTLANEQVWDSTHRFAAKCFTGAGLAGLVATFAGGAFWATAVLLGVGAMAPVAYSLVTYKQRERRGEV